MCGEPQLQRSVHRPSVSIFIIFVYMRSTIDASNTLQRTCLATMQVPLTMRYAMGRAVPMLTAPA